MREISNFVKYSLLSIFILIFILILSIIIISKNTTENETDLDTAMENTTLISFDDPITTIEKNVEIIGVLNMDGDDIADGITETTEITNVKATVEDTQGKITDNSDNLTFIYNYVLNSSSEISGIDISDTLTGDIIVDSDATDVEIDTLTSTSTSLDLNIQSITIPSYSNLQFTTREPMNSYGWNAMITESLYQFRHSAYNTYDNPVTIKVYFCLVQYPTSADQIWDITSNQINNDYTSGITLRVMDDHNTYMYTAKKYCCTVWGQLDDDNLGWNNFETGYFMMVAW